MSAQRKTVYVADGVTYFMGAPCKYGHDGLRYIRKRTCVHCHTARNRGRQTAEEGGVLTFVMLKDWRVVMP